MHFALCHDGFSCSCPIHCKLLLTKTCSSSVLIRKSSIFSTQFILVEVNNKNILRKQQRLCDKIELSDSTDSVSLAA